MSTTVLAACSAGEDPDAEPSTTPKPTPTASSTAPGAPTIVTFAVYGAAPVVAAYTKIAADFTAEHPDIVVNVRPYDTHDDAVAALDGDNDPDVFMAERSDLTALSEAGRIQPVDALLAEEGVDFGDGFQREALEAFSADASLKCMPVDSSPLVVYYNKRRVDLTRLTEDGERPVTGDNGWKMEQFAAAAQMASRRKVRGVYIAPTLEQVAPFVWSGGGTLVDDPTHPTTLTLSNEDSVQALEPLLELVRNPRLTFNQRQVERTSPVKLFKAGRLAMLLGYRELTPVLRQQQNLEFDVMPLPREGRRVTSGTIKGLCIAADAEHAEAAAEFIAYSVSDEPTALLASTGYVTPTNLDIANSDAFMQPDQLPTDAQVFTRTTRYIEPLPSGEGWEHVAGMARRMLTRLFYDPVIDPMEERLATIDERSAELFARYPPPSETPSPSPSATPDE
ncbi:MAG TPA: extracellular solute-binding protein [Marmoricola sp.]|jgi:multiple sugar transport system substrate-binding protein|nr:extracellular solute-binding protein [Marmoricola sp.]